MRLRIIGTGSTGNCYLLTAATGKSLMLDAGIPIRKAIPHLNGLVGLEGCLITHEHNDHSAAAKDISMRGINVYASQGTYEHITPHILLNRLKPVVAGRMELAGEFAILPFDTQHDAAEPLGFLVKHRPTGETLLYATDTYYLKNTFPGVHYWVVECNYDEEITDRMFFEGNDVQLQRRLMKSHMSLRRLKDTLAANDLTKTRKIVLVHLSDTRSNEARMVAEIQRQTGVDTIAARAGETIELNRAPF